MSAAHAFHLSLFTTDVARSVAFYRSLFGVEPANHAADYAKFEINEPALVLSLIPGASMAGGNLNHVGLRMPNGDALVAVQYRLEAAGYATQRENNVACCYSRQTKFWASDPDRTLWEIYILEPVEGDASCVVPGVEPAIGIVDGFEGSLSRIARWQHWLGQPLPEVIPHADNSLDEVRLEGLFNMQLEPGQVGRLLAEVRRVLRPGALVHVHGLVADQLLPPGKLSLPGPAAFVERIPLAAEPARCIAAAGFVNIRHEPCREGPYFVVENIGLKELKLNAETPAKIGGGS